MDVLMRGDRPYLFGVDAKGVGVGATGMPLADVNSAVLLDLDGDGRDELLTDGGLTPASFAGFRRVDDVWEQVPVPMWVDVPAGSETRR